MEEYENLKELVQIEIEVKEFEMDDGTDKNCTWINELISSTSRKGIIINKKPNLAMRLIRMGPQPLF